MIQEFRHIELFVADALRRLNKDAKGGKVTVLHSYHLVDSSMRVLLGVLYVVEPTEASGQQADFDFKPKSRFS